MKLCTGCRTTKPAGYFNRYAKSPDGMQPRCRECQRSANSAWREANRERSRSKAREWNAKHPERAAEHHYKARYGITWAEYEAMSFVQGGRCAICRQECASGQRLAVDHDHATGAIRSLLCRDCNLGLGRFMDSADLLTRALDYLREHTRTSVTETEGSTS